MMRNANGSFHVAFFENTEKDSADMFERSYPHSPCFSIQSTHSQLPNLVHVVARIQEKSPLSEPIVLQ